MRTCGIPKPSFGRNQNNKLGIIDDPVNIPYLITFRIVYDSNTRCLRKVAKLSIYQTTQRVNADFTTDLMKEVAATTISMI